MLTGPETATFNVPVSNVTTSDFVLRAAGSATNLGATRSCFDATSNPVSCFSGPVTSARLVPSPPLAPGGSYDLIVDPPSAPSAVTDSLGRTVDTTTTRLRAKVKVQEDQSTVFQWGTVSNPNTYGGSYTREISGGASASFSFTGTNVTWYTITGKTEGKADVYIDGVLKTTVDNSAASTHYKVARSYSGLAAKKHVIKIVVRGQPGTLGTGTDVAIDAFKVGAVLIGTPALTYLWARVADASASGGYVARSSTPGAMANLKFRGAGITWYTIMGPNMGIAKIFVDGSLVRTVDLYSATTVHKAGIGITDLSSAPHTVSVQPQSTKNPASTGTRVVLDAWSVEPG